VAGLFGDQGQQQQLQVVRRQLASARQAAVVGKAEAARTAATARMSAVPAMAVAWREPGVPMVVIVMMIVVNVVSHAHSFIS
jgi:hypothetical protein